jgi:hypothetical protein
MQTQSLLRRSYECWKVVLVIDWYASLDQHDLGCALDQLLSAAQSERRVIDDGALYPLKLLSDPCRIVEVIE